MESEECKSFVHLSVDAHSELFDFDPFTEWLKVDKLAEIWVEVSKEISKENSWIIGQMPFISPRTITGPVLQRLRPATC